MRAGKGLELADRSDPPHITLSRWGEGVRRACGPLSIAKGDHTGPGSLMFFSGIERTRVPVAANTAFAIAGAVAAVPGSPMPPHFLPPESAR